MPIYDYHKYIIVLCTVVVEENNYSTYFTLFLVPKPALSNFTLCIRSTEKKSIPRVRRVRGMTTYRYNLNAVSQRILKQKLKLF